jgi:hypothetical protein
MSLAGMAAKRRRDDLHSHTSNMTIVAVDAPAGVMIGAND